MNTFHADDGGSLPGVDAVLEMLNTAQMSGAVCALLTPAIKAKLRELEPGQVLEVRVDDPSARLDVQAWCQLTGNPLRAVLEHEGVLDFFIEKKNERQEVPGNG